jgi:phosphate transport system substrate-binding protein
VIRWATAATLLFSACSGDPPPPEGIVGPPIAPDPSVIRIAGSGAMVPLARALAGAFPGTPRVVVEESIGTGGGIRAAADGAVDLGMVSRALSDEEKTLGLAFVPEGLDAVVIAVHPMVATRALDGGELRALYSGERRTFPDGAPAIVLLRDRAESANGALEKAFPGLLAVPDGSPRRERMRVVYHDAAMVEALAATPGGIGVTNLGALTANRASPRVLSIDGKMPSVESLADGSWPVTRRLGWVARPDRLARARAFLDFAASDEGARITRATGYLPVSKEGR